MKGGLLGRKQSIPDLATWQAALEQADQRFPDDRLDALLNQTVTEVRNYAQGRRIAYGWSGGKDSLALQAVMDASGIHDGVLVISDLEFPAMLAWATDHMPDGLTVLSTGQNHQWLREHPEMLFPEGRYGTQWFRVVQHAGQRTYFKDRRLDAIALGRRRADGNYVGRGGAEAGGNIYTDRHGVTRWSPLADWSHEATLALLKRMRVTLPPCYQWPRGFQVGTGSWPARQWAGSRERGWAEVWQIDPDVVREAAGHRIPGAGEHLQKVGA